MNKKTKMALAPRMRFPEFINDDKWAISVLGKISSPITKRAGSEKYTLMSVTSGVGLISQTEKFGREIAGDAYKNYIVIQREDFAYNKSATKLFPEGYIAMLVDYDEAALPNSIFTCFHIDDNQVVAKFLDYLFQSNYHGSWLRKFISVGARAHGSLNVDDAHLWGMPIALPRLREQQKIADCLNSLDDLIDAENKKLAALKTHKKGLMQKLFPFDGKSAPLFRFSGFSKPWGFEELSKVCDYFVDGDWIEAKDQSQSGIRLIQTGNIGVCEYLDRPDRAKWISESTFIRLNCEEVTEGDILISRLPNPAGRACIVPNTGYKMITAVDCTIARVSKKCISSYLVQYLSSDSYFKAVSYLLAGGTRQRISRSSLALFKVPLPSVDEQDSIDEQYKIGVFFGNLDNLINKQSEKIETLQLHKKGLMHGLFPTIGEVIE